MQDLYNFFGAEDCYELKESMENAIEQIKQNGEEDQAAIIELAQYFNASVTDLARLAATVERVVGYELDLCIEGGDLNDEGFFTEEELEEIRKREEED